MGWRRSMSPESGFSLMEVMVAVIIICVGLLGIAKMQSLALSNTTVSRQRAIAAHEAASMASAMHANRDYWNAVVPPFTMSITSNPTAVVSSDGALQAGVVTPAACIAPAAGTAPQCTPVQLAGFDVARWWNNSLTVLLPNPGVSIQCSQLAGSAAPMSCQVQITWTEKAVVMNTQEQGQANLANVQFQTPTYTLFVQP